MASIDDRVRARTILRPLGRLGKATQDPGIQAGNPIQAGFGRLE